MAKVWSLWSAFWFSPVQLRKTSLFRVAAASIMLVYFAIRHTELPDFYYDTGMLSLEKARRLFDGVYHTPLFWFPVDPVMVQALHGLLLLLLLLLALGVWPRLMAAGALYLHVLFEHRNFLVMYGFDKVAAAWLFYLMLMRSDSHFSPRASRQFKSSDLLTPAAVRMAQIHLCVIYAYSGLEKFRGNSWWSGEALWSIVANGIVSPFDLSFVAHAPWLIYLGTYSTLLWEAYFPLAIWIPYLRRPWLVFGVVFHVMTAVMMNLVFFASIMIAGYLLFWDEPEQEAEPERAGTGHRFKLRV
ncbi:MAG TPA: HTTM domain-containing protein [Bdellovibrionales bacterium]|nr:HTTM domain-containing protein [Bdellovibrionales bacterium]